MNHEGDKPVKVEVIDSKSVKVATGLEYTWPLMLSSMYMVVATTVSAVVGYNAKYGEKVFTQNPAFSTLRPNTIREHLRLDIEGEPFLVSRFTLSRDWDFSARQVCTESTRESLYMFVPVVSHSISCQPMSDFPEKKIEQVRRKLPVATLTN